MSGASWFSEFRVEAGLVHYHQTGARIRVDASLMRDVAAWLTYYIPIRVAGGIRQLLRPGPKLWFTPHQPPPWYLIWNATAWIGARTAAGAADADACFYFEDATWASGVASNAMPCINGECRDVSKSHVAAVFERVFGYPLAVDPAIAAGSVVEKSELNGAHDGRVISCPRPARSDRVYQKLIETGDGDYVEDLRTPCVGGEPVVVFIKRRGRHERFANHNASVALGDPRELFSHAELGRIRLFARAMQLDWGGLDILRERESGRLYIVDVNKTDMPPLALPFLDKMRASRKLGGALEGLVRQYAQRTKP